jgi:hypothetical protein
LVAQELLEVFYAPHRAFKKIVQNPKFLGPLLIVVIFVAVQVSSAYVVASRSYLEQTLPTGEQGDTWTENAVLWQASSGVTIANNHVDYINGSAFYYNNTSIEFTAHNSTGIQMFLNDFGSSVNCGADGFKSLSIRVKIVSPSAIPQNVMLYLFSLSSPANFFSYDLTGAFSNSTILEQHFWNNITVPVGTTDWVSSNSAVSWGNITGLRMDFAWPVSSTIGVRVDGLFFRGPYKGSLDVYGSNVLINSALNSVTPFLFQWLLLTALMYLLIKGLKGNVVWKPVMVAVGFALVTLVVQSLILLAAYTTLSNVNYPLEILANIPGESAVAYQAVQTTIAQVLLVGSIVQVVIWVWIFALGTFITRAVTAIAPASPLDSTKAEGEGMMGTNQFSWVKCMLVSAASLALTVTILGFLGVG